MMSAERRTGRRTHIVMGARTVASEEIRRCAGSGAAGLWRKGMMLRKGRALRAGDAAISQVSTVQRASAEVTGRPGRSARTAAEVLRPSGMAANVSATVPRTIVPGRRAVMSTGRTAVMATTRITTSHMAAAVMATTPTEAAAATTKAAAATTKVSTAPATTHMSTAAVPTAAPTAMPSSSTAAAVSKCIREPLLAHQENCDRRHSQ